MGESLLMDIQSDYGALFYFLGCAAHFTDMKLTKVDYDVFQTTDEKIIWFLAPELKATVLKHVL